MLDLSRLGNPTLQLGGFKLWIHDRQYPDAKDYWDGNWFHATAHATAGQGGDGAVVWAQGAFLHLGDLTNYVAHVEEVLSEGEGEVDIEFVEPNLSLGLVYKKEGLFFVVTLSPEPVEVSVHDFEYPVGREDLDGLLASIRAFLVKNPVVGDPNLS